MFKVGFWNCSKKVKADLIASFAVEFDLDVLALCDYNRDLDQEIIYELNSTGESAYFKNRLLSPACRVSLFSKFSEDLIDLVTDQKHYIIRQFQVPNGMKILLTFLHLPSSLRRSENEQGSFSKRVMRAVNQSERKFKHRRSIIVGDFNMNPFNSAMVDAENFHAVFDLRIARKKFRIIEDHKKYYFYNPMWKFFQHPENSFQGTYFYHKSTEIQYFWHTYDQILLRPRLCKQLNSDSVMVVNELADKQLINKSGRPDKQKYSDHLPIILTLNNGD